MKNAKAILLFSLFTIVFVNFSLAQKGGGETNVVCSPLPGAPTSFQMYRQVDDDFTWDVSAGSCGGGNFQLSATPGSGGSTIHWYTTSTGGTFTAGLTYVTGTLATSKTYYATTFNSTGCESSPRTPVTITINPIPSIPTASSPTFCGGPRTVTLTATPGAGGSSVAWYDNNTYTSPQLGTGTPYNTVNLSQSKPYYVRTFNPTTYCFSTPVAVNVTINPKPAPPLVDDPIIYDAGNGATINATVGLGGDKVRWYDPDMLNTSYFYEGVSYVTPTLSNATSYNAASYDSTTTCYSDPTLVTVQIFSVGFPSSIQREIIRQPGITSDVQITPLDHNGRFKSTTYIDGSGRTVQNVDWKQSNSGMDVFSARLFDALGNVKESRLPYAATSTAGGYDPSFKSRQFLFYVGTGDKVADDSVAYATSKYEASPLSRIVEQGNVGKDWQPKTSGISHTNRVSYSYNISAPTDDLERVIRFNSDGDSVGYYAANLLSRTQTTDENGNIEVTFRDQLGNVVVRKKQLDQTIAGKVVSYLQTYYIYDDFARIKYVIPPGGLIALRATHWSSLTMEDMRNKHVYRFVYDVRGRLTQKKTPGQSWIWYAYDNMNRLVLVQDGNIRPSHKWWFIKYDSRNRAVMSGLYFNSTQTTLSSVQTILNGLYSSGAWFETKGTAANAFGYTNQSFPTQSADTNPVYVTNVIYFDDYDFDSNGTDDWTYDNSHLAGLPTARSSYVNGKITGSRTRILQSNNWLVKAVFYDDKGQTLQLLGNNHLLLTASEKSSMRYNFLGQVIQTKNSHSDGINTISTVQKYFYNEQGRLSKVKHAVNGGSDVVIAQLEYNEIGQIVDKKLHSSDTINFLQSIDYRYNIRGWLTSINNAQLSNDGTVSNDETTDYFGMELLYNKSDATGLGNDVKYNGNISAIKWKGLGNGNTAAGERAYVYAYDKTDKLIQGAFRKYGSSWNQERNTTNESIGYDHNGNILNLSRKRAQRSLSGITVTSTAVTTDSLSYNYSLGGTASGNLLGKVTDAVSDTTGFADGNISGDDYTYDSLGNVVADKNKGITSITYNFLGKPLLITFSTGRTVKYFYDASGNKLKTTMTLGSDSTRTDYSNGYLYTNGVLSFFGFQEGRVVKNGSDFEYQYSIADHQGNTRVIFTAAAVTPTSLVATFEGGAGDNSNVFQNVSPVAFVGANHTSGGSKVVGMNQATPTGPAKSMQVFPGDKIDLSVWSYYEGTSGFSTTTETTSFMISAISTLFGGVSGGAGEVGRIYSGITGSVGALGQSASSGDAVPTAHINYILFDKNYSPIDMGWTAISSGSFTKILNTIPTLTVKEPGYLYTYLSYEGQSSQYVYFDDFTITYTPTNVLQYNEYYPFGLQNQNSWTRSGVGNNFLYNDASELNSATKLYDLPFRNYDAALGRFFQVDAMALSDHSSSVFAYADNNPAGYNDPSGLTKADPNGFKSFYYWQKYDAAMNGVYMPWWDDFADMSGGKDGAGSGEYGWVPVWDVVKVGTTTRTQAEGRVTEWGIVGYDLVEKPNPFYNPSADAAENLGRNGDVSENSSQNVPEDGWWKRFVTWLTSPVLKSTKGNAERMIADRNAHPEKWQKFDNIGMVSTFFLPGGGIINLIKGKSLLEVSEYTLTKTVAANLATRPFLNSPLLVEEIMSTGAGVADASFEGGFNWVVEGTFNGSKGIYQLGINPETKVIYHLLFKTIP